MDVQQIILINPSFEAFEDFALAFNCDCCMAMLSVEKMQEVSEWWVRMF